MAMIKLFLILIVGFCCHKWGIFPEGTQTVLTKVVIYVATPCTILYSVLANEDLPDAAAIAFILLVSVGCYAVLIALALLAVRLMRVEPGLRGIYVCMLVFSNCGFIGFPVVETIFGSQAVFYTSVFNIPFYPFVYTLGAYLMIRDSRALGGERKRVEIKASTFLNPCLAASAAAIVLALTGWRFPPVLTDTIASIGNITTPGALLVIGISVARQPLKAMLGSARVYLLSVLRLIAVPTLVWFALHFFVRDQLLLGVAVVVFGMPVATAVPMLVTEYGADETSAVQGVFLTTVLSMVTIPLLVTVFM